MQVLADARARPVEAFLSKQALVDAVVEQVRELGHGGAPSWPIVLLARPAGMCHIRLLGANVEQIGLQQAPQHAALEPEAEPILPRKAKAKATAKAHTAQETLRLLSAAIKKCVPFLPVAS